MNEIPHRNHQSHEATIIIQAYIIDNLEFGVSHFLLENDHHYDARGQVPFYLVIFSESENNQMEFWVSWNAAYLEYFEFGSRKFQHPNIPNPDFI